MVFFLFLFYQFRFLLFSLISSVSSSSFTLSPFSLLLTFLSSPLPISSSLHVLCLCYSFCVLLACSCHRVLPSAHLPHPPILPSLLSPPPCPPGYSRFTLRIPRLTLSISLFSCRPSASELSLYLLPTPSSSCSSSSSSNLL